jgi:hypothetical protein
MRCRGLVHNGTHSNDAADNRLQDKGERTDETIDATTDGRDDGTLRYGNHNENRTPERVYSLPTIVNVYVETLKVNNQTRAEEAGAELILPLTNCSYTSTDGV